MNIFDDFSIRGKCHKKSANCLPIRSGAIHICIREELEDTNYLLKRSGNNQDSSATNGTPANIIKSMFALTIGGKLRSKLRIHTGTYSK